MSDRHGAGVTPGAQVVKSASSGASGWGCAIIAVGMLVLGSSLIVLGFFMPELLARWDGNLIQQGSPSTPLYILGGIFALIGGGWLVVEVISALNR